MVNSLGDFVRQLCQNALTCALAKKHGLDEGLHHVLRPAKGKGKQCIAGCRKKKKKNNA